MKRTTLALSVVLAAACNDINLSTTNDPPSVNVLVPAPAQQFFVGEPLTFSAHVQDDATDAEDLVLFWAVDEIGELSGTTAWDGDSVGFVPDEPLLPGVYTLVLRATDAPGESTEVRVPFTVASNATPVVGFGSPAFGARIPSGDPVEVAVSITDRDLEDQTSLTLRWGGVAEGVGPEHPPADGQVRFFLNDLPVGERFLAVQATDARRAVGYATLEFEIVSSDADGDGVRAAEFGGADCDDTRAEAGPGKDELCNGEDDDCDGVRDEGPVDAPTWYEDRDNDGFGDVDRPITLCERPLGTVANADDCDDALEDVNPNGVEACNGADDDCDGDRDEGALDLRTYWRDNDGDSYGDPAGQTLACQRPAGYAGNDDDCDDRRDRAYPGAPESCNDADDDCDRVVDEDATDADTWFRDVDADGAGTRADTVVQCDPPAGYVGRDDDCDDGNAGRSPLRAEDCDGFDDDCDGRQDVDAVGDSYCPCPVRHRELADGTLVPYQFCASDEVDWLTASTGCAAVGGYRLADISDADENTWVYETAADEGGFGVPWWFGLNDRTTEGSFVWSSGQALGFTAWHAGEPNNLLDIPAGEDCAEIGYWPTEATWNDKRCDELRFYICER